MIAPLFRRLVLCLLAAAPLLGAACRSDEPPAPPVAAPRLTLSHDRASAGSPLELTYRFEVAPDAAIDRDYRVLSHFVDLDEELMWTDDHDPPVPTSQWKPGQTIEYTRTVFVPPFPYVGEAAIHVGLYSQDGTRLPLAGDDTGQRAYRVARLNMVPQTENLFTVFKDGWHPAEVAGGDNTIEWQWTKQQATLAFRNPRKDAVLYLDLDSPGKELHPPQEVEVTIGGTVLDRFTLEPDVQQLRKIRVPADALGSEDMAELQITVDKSFVPARVPGANSKDYRELGVRVFHAFVDHR
jgi:hypothetical protein